MKIVFPTVLIAGLAATATAMDDVWAPGTNGNECANEVPLHRTEVDKVPLYFVGFNPIVRSALFLLSKAESYHRLHLFTLISQEMIVVGCIRPSAAFISQQMRFMMCISSAPTPIVDANSRDQATRVFTTMFFSATNADACIRMMAKPVWKKIPLMKSSSSHATVRCPIARPGPWCKY